MHVDLQTLQPNPLRDFTIDPMDPEAVERLRRSIADDGFWDQRGHLNRNLRF